MPFWKLTILTESGWVTDANADRISKASVVTNELGGRGATPLDFVYRVLREFLERAGFVTVDEVSGNGKRNARNRVADNGWTRHGFRSKHDVRHKESGQKHDQRLEGTLSCY